MFGGVHRMNIDLFDDIMKTHNQYRDDSDLWKAIKQVTNCTDAEAKKAATFHCNSLSFYALCRARGFIEFYYSTWLDVLDDADYLDIMTGWVKADKLSIADIFGFFSKFNRLNYNYDYEDVMAGRGLAEGQAYDIKVFNNHNKLNHIGEGDHYMGAYPFNGSLYLSDSGNRGYRVEARKVIPRAKFQWGLVV